MSSQSNSLNVIVNPPGGEQLEPGATSQIRIVITNQSNYPMKAIEVELDLPPEINDWCKVKRTSFNLDSGRSEEVVFNWVIPSKAIVESDYNYHVVVDCRDFLNAPLHYLRQLKISTPVVRQPRSTDPEWSLNPPTSSTKPIVWQREQNLSIIVLVHNRSNFVDEFRISCDLNDNWYSVRYPERIEEMGVISSGNKLSLNPNSTGQIILSIDPPPNPLAGNYQPTINLHSKNQPDLVLQDSLYLRIPPIHNLQVELQTIHSKVKQKSALYNIQFRNEGNSIRKVNLQARTADEDEFCEYQLERNEVRIPPGKVVDVGLKVAVKRKSQRSFFKAKHLEFLVEIEDLENNPLPIDLLRSTLLWEARPFWHFLVLILIALLILVGAFFLVWEIINKIESAQVAEILEVEPEDTEYEFNEKITLTWKIKNADRLEAIRFRTEKSPEGTIPIDQRYTKSKLLDPNHLVKRFDCKKTSKEKELNCNRVATNASAAGTYNFVFEVYSEENDSEPSDTKRFEVKIAEPDKPSVSNLKVAKDEYKPGEKIYVEFEINRPERVKSIEIISRNEFSIRNKNYDGKARDEQEISLEKLKETRLCDNKQENPLECSVPISFAREGNNDLSIRLISNYEPHNQPEPISEQLERSIAIEKPSTRLKIISFTINGRNNSPVSVKSGQRINLRWKVQGEDVYVSIEGVGGVLGSSGTSQLGRYEPGTYSIELKATDKEGNTASSTIHIQVESPPEPVELPQE